MEIFDSQRHKLLNTKDACFDAGSPMSLDRFFSDFPENRLNLSDNARSVLRKIYLKKDRGGRVTETPGQMFRQSICRD
jgi:hypothetical protein